MLGKIMKRNQFIIAALTVMIAVAGYLNYSESLFGNKETLTDDNTELAAQELLDISEEDVETDIEGIEQGGEVEGTPGEAVLTSAGAESIAAEAKINREQVRAKNKETLQGIIDDPNLSEESKTEAVAQMVELTEIAEKEATIETLLLSKGFENVVVSLSEDSADIVVENSNLTDVKRAQIEDIVTRKSGIPAANVIITSIHNGENTK